jgi:hypothetical protein
MTINNITGISPQLKQAIPCIIPAEKVHCDTQIFYPDSLVLSPLTLVFILTLQQSPPLPGLISCK